MSEQIAESGAPLAECGHPTTKLYAIKMADPQGVAKQGEHFGCEDCDALDASVSDLDVWAECYRSWAPNDSSGAPNDSSSPAG